MAKIVTWDDGKTKSEVYKRFKHTQEARKRLEDRWLRNESTLYTLSANQGMSSFLQNSMENNFQIGMPGVDGSNADVSVAYTFKNLRFIHAQMSANPPAVAMRPTSSDQEDHRRADAADRISRWAMRHYQLQETTDQLSLHCLVYGSGFVKTVWDSSKGDIIEFDEQNDEITMEGDISITVPFIWNVFIDPDAKTWGEVKYMIERIFMDADEAAMRWPEKAEILKKAKVTDARSSLNSKESRFQDNRYNSVELIEYWETGLPTNGYLGRYCITTLDGDVVQSCRPSPHRFTKAGAISRVENSNAPDEVKLARIPKLPQQASLPYVMLTDIDVPNYVWGRSFVEYTSGLQDSLNRLDSTVLDNIQAHGVARMILPESAEISDDSLGNSPWDVVKITGNQPPYYMQAPTLMPEMTRARQDFIQGINDISGVNDSMFGNQSREQSGASMQYATNQGNMIRRRLFNKYVLAVECLHKSILSLVRKHWTTQRTISVIGKERALEAVDIKGSDIDGGYDVVGEYGVTLSLDPITRREELLALQPIFEKAGVPIRKSLELMKLNELEGMFDRLEMAGTRQKEIFDEMIASGRYVPPEDLMDHENMIAWALDYFMSQEFTSLALETKQLLKQHVRDRGAVAAQEKGGGSTSTPAEVAAPANAAPGPIPGGAPEMPAPMGAPTPAPVQ
jgi:hypothetical protein